MKMTVSGLPEDLTDEQQHSIGQSFLIALYHMGIPMDGMAVNFESKASSN